MSVINQTNVKLKDQSENVCWKLDLKSESFDWNFSLNAQVKIWGWNPNPKVYAERSADKFILKARAESST